MKLLGLDRRFDIADRLDRRAGRPQRERVVQDIEVPTARLAEFLDVVRRRDRHAPGVAVPARRATRVAGVPARGGRALRQRRLLGHRPRRARRPPTRRATGRSRPRCTELGGHKSLYSEAFYDRETFDRLYGGAHVAAVEGDLRPRRPPDRASTTRPCAVSEQEVSTAREQHPRPSRSPTSSPTSPAAACRCASPPTTAAPPGPPDAEIGLELVNQRGLQYLVTAPGDLGLARAYVAGDLVVHGAHPGNPYEVMQKLKDHTQVPRPDAGRAASRSCAASGCRNLKPPAPPPQEHLPRWRRMMEGVRHSLTRDAEVDLAPLRRLQRLLPPRARPLDGLHLRGLPRRRRDASRRRRPRSSTSSPASSTCSPASGCSTSAAAGAAWSCTPAKEYGVKALGVTLSRQQAEWAKEAIDAAGLGDLAEVRHLDYREVLESDFDAVSSIGLTEHIGVRQLPAYFSFLRDKLQAPRAACSTTASPATTTGPRSTGAFIDRYVFPDGELTGSGRIITEAQDAGLEVMHSENLRLHYAMTLRDWNRNLVEQLGRVRRGGRPRHRPRLGPLHGRLPGRVRAQRGAAAPGARGPHRRRRRRRVRAAPDLGVVSRAVVASLVR